MASVQLSGTVFSLQHHKENVANKRGRATAKAYNLSTWEDEGKPRIPAKHRNKRILDLFP